jgi:mono/diheme cytochrome c family protein
VKTFLAYGTIALGVLGAALMVNVSHGTAGAAAQASGTASASTGNAENGKRLYNKNGCFECHGIQGQGSPITGPRLGPDPVPFEAFRSYVRKPVRNMPPVTDKVLSDKDLKDIYAFLQSLPHPPPAKSIPILQY